MSDDWTAASARDQGLTPDNHGRAGDIAEQERQFRELLEHCPAALDIVDEEGRILFHNARLREARRGTTRTSCTSSTLRGFGPILSTVPASLKHFASAAGSS